MRTACASKALVEQTEGNSSTQIRTVLTGFDSRRRLVPSNFGAEERLSRLPAPKLRSQQPPLAGGLDRCLPTADAELAIDRCYLGLHRVG